MLTLKTNEKTPTKKSIAKSEPGVYFVQKTIGQDTYLVMAQAAVELEDEWSSLYYTTANQSNLFLQPPFEPTNLLNLAQTNNTLLQCIEAMEVNIDGTGCEFVAMQEGDTIDEAEQKEAESFFREPYPGHSFVKIRRKLRRQMEQVGYAFLEVLRNVAGDIVGLRNVETQHVRFVKLDAPIQVTKTVTRNGKDVKLTMWDRERRFAQRIALKQLVYYREFGTSRQINRDTGAWETSDAKIPLENQGTELLCFGIHPDITGPYFVPRWINELPSVIGSRKAEEQNLQFLDSGGLPPAIIFVQGGTLAKDASDQLRTYLSGANKNKYRAVVVEAQSSSGSIDSAGNVQVKVERFGSASAQDAMFMKYDVITEDHVRKGFRLPPLFLGEPADYNFATAVTAYMVAEEQVFQPERSDFDATINSTVLKALGFKTIRMKSKPIRLKDVANQIQGMGIAKDLATRESLLKEINSTTGMDLELAAIPQPDSVSATFGPDGKSVATESTIPPGAKTISQTPHELLPGSVTHSNIAPQKEVHQLPPEPQANPNEAEMQKLKVQEQQLKNKNLAKGPKKATELIDLAHDYACMRGLVRKRALPIDRALVVKEEVASLTGEDRDAFEQLLAQYAFGKSDAQLQRLVRP
jgi:PBSX family phage portal protein